MDRTRNKTAKSVLKKVVVFVVLGAMVFSIAACGGKGKKPAQNTTAQQNQVTTAAQKQTTTAAQNQATTAAQNQTTAAK